MKYRERRTRIFELMSEAGQLIREAGDDKTKLWAVATDDLSEAVSEGGPVVGLREAFTEAARAFWLRENQAHSVRVPDPPVLRLVTAEQFDDLVKEGSR